MRALKELVRQPGSLTEVAAISAALPDAATTLMLISRGGAFIPGRRTDRLDNTSLF